MHTCIDSMARLKAKTGHMSMFGAEQVLFAQRNISFV